MARHRSHSIEFKRQVAQGFLPARPCTAWRSATTSPGTSSGYGSTRTRRGRSTTTMLVMAWSPVRRVNAGLIRVEAPGDYATLNSNQLRDSTHFEAFAVCDIYQKPNFDRRLKLEFRASPMTNCV